MKNRNFPHMGLGLVSEVSNRKIWHEEFLLFLLLLLFKHDAHAEVNRATSQNKLSCGAAVATVDTIGEERGNNKTAKERASEWARERANAQINEQSKGDKTPTRCTAHEDVCFENRLRPAQRAQTATATATTTRTWAWAWGLSVGFWWLGAVATAATGQGTHISCDNDSQLLTGCNYSATWLGSARLKWLGSSPSVLLAAWIDRRRDVGHRTANDERRTTLGRAQNKDNS